MPCHLQSLLHKIMRTMNLGTIKVRWVEKPPQKLSCTSSAEYDCTVYARSCPYMPVSFTLDLCRDACIVADYAQTSAHALWQTMPDIC